MGHCVIKNGDNVNRYDCDGKVLSGVCFKNDCYGNSAMKNAKAEDRAQTGGRTIGKTIAEYNARLENNSRTSEETSFEINKETGPQLRARAKVESGEQTSPKTSDDDDIYNIDQRTCFTDDETWTRSHQEMVVKTCIKCYTTKSIVFLDKNKSICKNV